MRVREVGAFGAGSSRPFFFVRISGRWNVGWLPAVARYLVGLVFLSSGLAKLWFPGPFPTAVSRLVPVAAFHPVVIVGLPLFEVVVGLLVLAGVWRRQVSRAVFGLAACFVVVRLAAFGGLLDWVPCGCFGSVLELEERAGFALDLLVLAFSAVLVRR